MESFAFDHRISQHCKADSVETLRETFRAAPINHVQTSSGHLGADIRTVSTDCIEVREVSLAADLLMSIERTFPRFAFVFGIKGSSQLYNNKLTSSNIGYSNGANGIIASIQANSSWCSITIDHELLLNVAETHHYSIPDGDGTYGLPFNQRKVLVHKICQIARSQCFIELNNEQFHDVIALCVLRALNPSHHQDTPSPSQRSIIAQRIIEYIQAHYFEPMSVTGLCQLIGISERAMQYSFLKTTGISVQQYLMNYRLHRAHELLSKGKVAEIKDAALACGIPHRGRFSKYFKGLFGISPRQVLLAPNTRVL